jgi:hypothetical protein
MLGESETPLHVAALVCTRRSIGGPESSILDSDR